MNVYFTKEDTRVIKGIAVMLMLIHHLYFFPDRMIGNGLSCQLGVWEQNFVQYISAFGKICVSIFFFLSGYGIYKSAIKRKFDLIARLKSVYISYWKVFIIFVPIAFLCFSNQPTYCKEEIICHVYQKFSITEFINNLIGLSCSYNREWWFLISYVYAVITFPIIKKLIDRFSVTTDMVWIMAGNLLMYYIFPNIKNIEYLDALTGSYVYKSFFCQASPFISCFWMGCLLAKDKLFEELKNSLQKNKMLGPVKDLCILGLIVYLRVVAIGQSIDMVYVPFFVVYMNDLLLYLKPVRKIAEVIGKESTNMWLIHTFFCYYFYPFAKLISSTNEVIIAWFVLMFISYIASVVVTMFWNNVEKIYRKINLQL